MLRRGVRAGIAAAFMQVHTAETHGAAVEQHHLVADFNFTHAYALGNLLAAAAQQQGIQYGRFSRPKQGSIQVKRACAVLHRARCKQRVIGRIQLALACTIGLTEGCAHLHAGRLPIVRQRGAHAEINHMTRVATQQIHIAEDAAVTELILILAVAARAPLAHQRTDGVFAVHQRGGHIILRRGVRHLACADKLPVYPQKQAAIHALKHQLIHRARLLIQRKATAIQPAGIICRHIGRIIGKREAHIGILNMIVPIHLPRARHRHGSLQRLGHGIKIRRKIPHAGIILKLPLPIQQRKTAAAFPRAARILIRVKRNKIGVRRIFARVHQDGIQRFNVLLKRHKSSSSFAGVFYYYTGTGCVIQEKKL